MHYIDDEGKRKHITGPTVVLLLPDKHIRDDHRRGKIDDPLGEWNNANIGIDVGHISNIDRGENKPKLDYLAFKLRKRLQEERPKLNPLNGLWKLYIDRQVYLCSSDKTLTQIYDHEDHKRDLPPQQPLNYLPPQQPSNDQQPSNALPPQQAPVSRRNLPPKKRKKYE